MKLVFFPNCKNSKLHADCAEIVSSLGSAGHAIKKKQKKKLW